MGDRSISELFRLSHGSLVGHQLSARQTDRKSLTVIMQPDLGEIFWASPRVLAIRYYGVRPLVYRTWDQHRYGK